MRESAGEGFEQHLLFSYAMATPGKPDSMRAESLLSFPRLRRSQTLFS